MFYAFVIGWYALYDQCLVIYPVHNNSSNGHINGMTIACKIALMHIIMSTHSLICLISYYWGYSFSGFNKFQSIYQISKDCSRWNCNTGCTDRYNTKSKRYFHSGGSLVIQYLCWTIIQPKLQNGFVIDGFLLPIMARRLSMQTL